MAAKQSLRIVEKKMNHNVYLRSFLRRPGVMNAQIWYSHNGAVNTAPEIVATLSRVVKPLNTPV